MTEYTLHGNRDSPIAPRTLRLSCTLAGVLFGLTYPPYGFYATAWFCLIPLFLSARLRSPRTAFINAWLFYLCTFSVAFYWPLFHIRSDTAIASAVAWIALTMLLATPIGMAAALANKFGKAHCLSLTGLLVLLVEVFFRIGPVPMPGTGIGYSQTMSGVMLRAASFVGSTGISAAIVLSSVGLAGALLKRGKKRRLRLFLAALPPLILIALGSRSEPSDTDRTLSVLVIQPGTSAEDWSNVRDESRVWSMMTRTDSVVIASNEIPELILWPETTLPIVQVQNDSIVLDSLSAWVNERSFALLTGGIVFQESRDTPGPPFFNAAILFQSGRPLQFSFKNILVPFAEHVPFSTALGLLNRLAVPAGGVSGYQRGTTPSVLNLGGTTVGILICFEAHFPEYSTKLVRAESQILFLLTQNGWWKGAAPFEQNFNYARFRAAETGRTVVVASVNGVSGVIGPQGNVSFRTGRDEPADFYSTIPVSGSRTAYDSLGIQLNWSILGIWSLLLLFQTIRARTSTESTE